MGLRHRSNQTTSPAFWLDGLVRLAAVEGIYLRCFHKPLGAARSLWALKGEPVELMNRERSYRVRRERARSIPGLNVSPDTLCPALGSSSRDCRGPLCCQDIESCAYRTRYSQLLQNREYFCALGLQGDAIHESHKMHREAASSSGEGCNKELGLDHTFVFFGPCGCADTPPQSR